MSTLVDAPDRVDGVHLIGEMVGSGYRTPPSLVRRSDGQVLQLTPLLYLVLSAVDGHRSCAEIADLVSHRLRRGVTADHVRALVDSHLRPLGLLRAADGSEPELRRSNPLLSIKGRIAVTAPQTTRRLTDPFRVLFRPAVTALVLLCFVAIVVWVFFDRGLGPSTLDAFQRPHLLVLVFVVSLLSGGFHEFGHAAAARYGGAEPGVMGAGLYLVWPAFYTDVTDSYRLGKGGRIRTDLGGLYFNAIVVVLAFAGWWATGWDAVLLVVATQVMQMVKQVQPLLRFDGYHLLADLAGVPDLYQRIRPTLLGLLPHRWTAPENRVLTRWARTVITLWVLVTVPLMAAMLLAMVAAVPRILGTAGSSLQGSTTALGDAWTAGDYLDVAAHGLGVLGVVLPMLACALVLFRFGSRFFRGLARWSHGSWSRRVVAALVSATVVTALSWAWWPHPGSYRPIQPGERGVFTTLLQAPQQAAAAGPARPAADLARAGRLTPGVAVRSRLSGKEPLVAAFPEGRTLPTKEHPELAMVLVSTSDGGAEAPVPGGTATGPAGAGGPADAWVFPFDQPLPPAEGDNQALAVATADGSVRYDVAFALVWADGDEVLNVNEAHAYASCTDCVAVAVAFQVVLIMDDAHVVVPQNLAVAANYDCYRCITAAIADQLVLSVDDPGEDQLRTLGEVWGRLVDFAHRITSYSLAEVDAQLEGFKAEIISILGDAVTVDAKASAVPTGSATPAAGTDPSPSPEGASTGSPSAPTGATTPAAPAPTAGSTATTPSPDATTSPPASATTGSSGPSPTPSPSPSPTPSTSPTLSPSASASP